MNLPKTMRITTTPCPLCVDPITVTCRLTSKGETKPSDMQPNPEGGTLDAVYTLEIVDPEPLYAHLRGKHEGVVPLGDLPPYEDAPPEENFWDDRTTPDANGRP